MNFGSKPFSLECTQAKKLTDGRLGRYGRPHVRRTTDIAVSQKLTLSKLRCAKNHLKLSQICSYIYGILLQGTQERVQNCPGKRTISVRATEVLLYSIHRHGQCDQGLASSKHLLSILIHPPCLCIHGNKSVKIKIRYLKALLCFDQGH